MDSSFGPRLLGHFDFTLLFEDSIFHIAPSAILVIVTLFFLVKVKNGIQLVRGGRLLCMKLFVAAALTAVQAGNVALWYQAPVDSTLAKAAAILSCVAAVCIAIITYANHVYFIRPLPFLGLFLSITLILDAVTTRTYFLRNGLHTIARLHIAIPVLKLVLLVLEEVSKRPLVISAHMRDSLGDESFAGFLSTSSYFWLNPIMIYGMRERITTDLLPGISPDIDPITLNRNFMANWATTNKASKFALAKTVFFADPWPYIYVILPRLFFIGFKFGQPFLLQDVVSAVAEKTQDKNLQTGLILATVFIYVGTAISRGWFLYIKNQMQTSARAILVTAIYDKSLRLGKDASSEEAAVTLINTDVANVMQLINLSYECWGRMTEVVLGIIILALFVGLASIFSLVPTTLASIFTIYISKRLAFTRKRWNNHIQNRVADTSNMLAQIKDIKMVGLAPTLAKRLQEQQIEETQLALADRRAVVSTFAFSAIGETVTPVLVVAGTMFWTRAGEPITSARFFTTLAVVTMISAPLADFIMGLPAWAGAFGAVSRIQAYLTQAEVLDERQLLPENYRSPLGAPTSTNRRSARLQTQQLPVTAVEMTLLSVSMGRAASVLRDVSIAIPLEGITMFIGPVGCGKSSLLNAIIGQAKLSTGSIGVSTKNVAYCAQRPWLRNTTIRSNVIGCNVYDAQLYAEVIHICALEEDLDALPLGDMTLCGSGGCKLSGGQKSRVALARTFYARAQMVVLDDPFSALDRETSSTIRIRLFGESGFLEENHITLIMTTSMQEHLVDAKTAFRVLDNGRVHRIPDEELEAPRLGNGPRTTPMVQPTVQVSPSEEVYTDKDLPPSVQPTTEGDTLANIPDPKFGDFSLWAYFASPVGIARILGWSLLVIVAAIMERMPYIFSRIWLDNDPQNLRYFAGFAAFGCLNPIMNYIACYSLFYLINISAIETIHFRLADTTANATFDFLVTEDAGSLLNRFSNDITNISQRLPLFILPTIWGALSVLIDIGVIASGASYASPIMPVLLLFLFIVQYFYLRTSRQLRVLELDSGKLLVRQVTETGAGIDHITTFGWKAAFLIEFYEVLEQTQKPFYYLASAQQWLLFVLDMFSAGAGAVMVSIALNYPSSASANSMGLAFVSLVTFSQTMSLFVRYYVNAELSFGGVARIKAFEQNTPTEKDDGDRSNVPASWPQHGRVDINGINATYRSVGTDGQAVVHTALQHVTIVVEPGQTLGLMGRTGSGKTSVFLALLRLINYSGSISIDGVEIKSVPLDTLRTRITTITQTGLELRASVRKNLSPFGPDSFPPGYVLTSQMEDDVLQRVGLLDRINMRGGLDSPFMEMRFSYGQKQLFQLARAMLHKDIMNSRILLVDEGTSSMDEVTERRMQTLIREHFTSCTKLIITHRLDIFNYADAVIKLTNGLARTVKLDREAEDWRNSPDI